MSNDVRSPYQAASRELIAKLVSLVICGLRYAMMPMPSRPQLRD